MKTACASVRTKNEAAQGRRVVVVLKGGIGNQMFQYAFARAMTLQHGGELVLVYLPVAATPTRAFALDCFNIAGRIGGKRHNLLAWAARSVIGRTIGRVGWYKVLNDAQRGHEPPQWSPHCIARGYWQSPHYFADVAETIRNDFQFAQPPTDENADMLTRIGEANAVAVHVRRTDYVQGGHGVCGIGYYERAARMIAERETDPHLFVFSDDPQWTRENLTFDLPVTFVTHNTGRADHEDLRLMTACQHFIIPNSTFSWWGAWLSNHPGKIVIAPRPWSRNPDTNASDPCPDDWLRLPGELPGVGAGDDDA